MTHFGYETAESVTVKETERVQYAFGQEKSSNQVSYDSKQLLSTKITYVRPENMDQKKIIESIPTNFTFSRIHE